MIREMFRSFHNLLNDAEVGINVITEIVKDIKIICELFKEGNK